MKRVEIIGVNYIGKSTFLKRFAFKSNEYSFCVVNDIRRKYRRSHPIQWYSKRVLQIVFSNIFNQHCINPYKFNSLEDLNADYINRFRYVLELCFRAESSSVTVADKILVYEKVKKYIKKLNFIDENSDSLHCDVILLEEFFLHRNEFLFKNLKLLESEKLQWKNDQLINPDAVIFFYADNEFLSKNISKRKSDGLLNRQHIHLSENEILKELSNQHILYSRLVSLLEDNGVKSLRLDSSLPFLVQKDKCLGFIQNL
jgi:hypothetical protein